MTFKLPKQKSNTNSYSENIPGTPVYRKQLENGINGEANNDGSIYISDQIQPGSEQEKITLMEEVQHQTHMKTGKLGYDDNYITWEGQKYPRIDGHVLYMGKFEEEGSKNLPWEQMPWV
tara:strand:- start:56 stop:412 length:357 start_codon:yes stop_codon:yes gene_type:complete